jgi:hypothetical protein
MTELINYSNDLGFLFTDLMPRLLVTMIASLFRHRISASNRDIRSMSALSWMYIG